MKVIKKIHDILFHNTPTFMKKSHGWEMKLTYFQILANIIDWLGLGKLNYFSNTMPNISYIVNTTSKFLKALRPSHWDANISIVWYLKRNPRWGILFWKNGHLRMEGLTNEDWIGSPSDRRSNIGYWEESL